MKSCFDAAGDYFILEKMRNIWHKSDQPENFLCKSQEMFLSEGDTLSQFYTSLAPIYSSIFSPHNDTLQYLHITRIYQEASLYLLCLTFKLW